MGSPSVGTRLKGKVCLITGAGSGLGRAAAVRFAEEGASLVCSDISHEAVNETSERISHMGGQALALTVDVANEAEVESMVNDAIDRFRRIDVLYANAGIMGEGRADMLDLDSWHRVLSVNLTGVWLSAKHALREMVKQGEGVVLTQGSVAGLVGLPGVAAYAAAKGGVISLTRQLARDFSPLGIRVNCICPAAVLTPLVEHAYQQRGWDLQDAGEKYPLGRLGEPEDVANLALFLASDESAWITGAVYRVDGGLTGTR